MAAGVGVGQVMTGAMTNALGLGGVAAPAGAGVVIGADGGMGVGVMAGGVQQPIPVQAAPVDPNSPQAKLGQLKGLLDQGLISQADYDSAKAEVLKKLIG
jgi:membrane protease subunit (stomatin/prohibitin family)